MARSYGSPAVGLAWDGIDLEGMAERFINDLDKDLRGVLSAVGAAAKANARAEALNEFPNSEVYVNSFQVEVQRPGSRGQFSIVLWNTHPVAKILEDGQKANYTYPGLGEGDVRRIVEDALRSGYDGGISIEPHIGAVFHDDTVKTDDDRRYAMYVEYGRRMEAMIADIRKAL